MAIKEPHLEEISSNNNEKKEGKNFLKISNFGTIFGDNFQEMSMDDFLKKLDENIVSDKYNIFYDSEKKRFNITYSGEVYYLELTNDTMNNHIHGSSNYLGKLNLLTERKKHIMETEKYLQNELNKKNEMIENINHTGIIPSVEARDIYLEYLNDKSKKNKHDLLKKLGLVIYGSLASLVCLCTAPGFIIALAITDSDIFFIGSFISIPFLLLKINAERNITKSKCLSLKKRLKMIKEIKNKFIDYKLNKQKIKKISEGILIEAKSVEIEFEKESLEPTKESSYEFNDKIMKNIDDIINRLRFINPPDRNRLLTELKKILDEYTERLNAIASTDEKGLRIDSDSIDSLKYDIVGKLADIEMEILKARDKDGINQINHEKQLLEDKINDSYYIEPNKGKVM